MVAIQLSGGIIWSLQYDTGVDYQTIGRVVTAIGNSVAHLLVGWILRSAMGIVVQGSSAAKQDQAGQEDCVAQQDGAGRGDCVGERNGAEQRARGGQKALRLLTYLWPVLQLVPLLVCIGSIRVHNKRALVDYSGAGLATCSAFTIGRIVRKYWNVIVGKYWETHSAELPGRCLSETPILRNDSSTVVSYANAESS